MTLEELASTLPSGFHDSALKGLAIDYERRVIRMHLSLTVGDPDGSRDHRDDCRDAELEISGVVFLVMDPPHENYDFNSPGEVWIVDGYETCSIPELTKNMDGKLLEAVPKDAFVHSFFVNDWNSYIHVAARDCAIKWIGDAYSYRGPRQHFLPGETIDS